jgi:hypothetical protein
MSLPLSFSLTFVKEERNENLNVNKKLSRLFIHNWKLARSLRGYAVTAYFKEQTAYCKCH